MLTSERLIEVWPFHDEESGARIQANRYYGFADGGGLAGNFKGYETPEALVTELKNEGHTDDDISTKPADLGGVSVCILSGRQFIDHIYSIEPENPLFILYIGHWDNMSTEEVKKLRGY